MAGMSTNVGLVSGLDTKTLVSQLMQVEANPQNLLKNKLVATNADGAGYRAVNLRFDSLRSAAAALSTDATWTATKASSSSASVTATAGPAASAGTLTFTVENLATTHSMFSATELDAGPRLPATSRTCAVTVRRPLTRSFGRSTEKAPEVDEVVRAMTAPVEVTRLIWAPGRGLLLLS